MIDPLPRWAKVFVALFAVALVAAALGAMLDDDLGAAEPARWWVAPGASLGPTSREVPIVVNEVACASGRSAEGRIVVEVVYGSDAIDIEVGVRTVGGDVECPSNPDTPFTVELTEPLGDRTITGERRSLP
ncbi:MAG: hypothetical protein NTZ21_12215 [Actinobacteria bacterium]|nr:hypothetical protein [Actinomycetota bacterium]